MVFIHPANGTAEQWSDLHAFLPSDRYYLAPDLRGHGRSVQHPGPFEFDALVDDVRELLDALALQSVHLIGGSIGGAIAAKVAFLEPRRVRSIVAIGSGLRGPSSQDSTNALDWIDTYGTGGMLEKVMSDCFPDGAAEDLVRRAWLTSNRHGAPEVAKAIWRGVLDLDITSYARQLRCRSLVINGEFDRTFPPAAGQEFAQATAGSYRTLAEAGHLPMFDAPQALAEMIVSEGILDAPGGAQR